MSITTAMAPKAQIIEEEVIHTPTAEPVTTPKITVMGVGGAGGNAVANMMRSKLQGVEFVVANTDAQALVQSPASTKIQLGLELTHGLGAGSKPAVGKAAAEEANADVEQLISNSNMLFITAGMGGGTGTGAAPVVAKLAREKGILTVGVVTKPFHFEGAHRMRTAEAGIEELQKHVDTLIVIPNQNLFRVANEKTTFADAFKMADDVLYDGVRSVTDLMIIPGLINLDFADIRSVMTEMGKAMMGTGEAEGENRAIMAAEAAISNPLLDDVCMRGAKGVLISVTGGSDMTLYEVDEAANRIRDEVEVDANIIFGSTFDESLNGRIRVSVVATGIDQSFTNAASLQSKFEEMQDTPTTIQEMEIPEPFIAEPQVFTVPNAEEDQNVSTFELNLGIEERQENETHITLPEEDQQTVDQTTKMMTTGDRYDTVLPQHGQQNKRPTLFERFTRTFRGDSKDINAEQNAGMRVRSPSGITPPDETSGGAEVSDIPAFLRRQNGR